MKTLSQISTTPHIYIPDMNYLLFGTSTFHSLTFARTFLNSVPSKINPPSSTQCTKHVEGTEIQKFPGFLNKAILSSRVRSVEAPASHKNAYRLAHRSPSSTTIHLPCLTPFPYLRTNN